MNLIQDAMAIHAEAHTEANGVPYLVKRGRIQNVMMATPATPRIGDEETAMDAQIQVKAQDFLIRPEAYILGGQNVEPADGDTVWPINQAQYEETGTITPTGEIFEVGSADSPGAWNWSDGYRTFFRVHTVRRKGPNVQGQ